ncbi:MAG: DNA alkylation repair protein [Prevotellaceae bacterium]|nr:DNA alkylation repair protein [Prevotellaceae bacterium]
MDGNTLHATLIEIKKEFRANMNGVASAYMRRCGLVYHVIFGIELPRLKEIAVDFPSDSRLAEALWQEDVRESKILASLLMPVEGFTPQRADEWAAQIPNAEIAQMTVMNLFARLPYAKEKAFRWMPQKDAPLISLCGFLLIARLRMQGQRFTPEETNEAVSLIKAIPPTADAHLSKAARNALLRLTE